MKAKKKSVTRSEGFTPYHALLEDIMEDAFLSASKVNIGNDHSMKTDALYRGKRALRWINDRERNDTLSFIGICTIFNLDHNLVRSKLGTILQRYRCGERHKSLRK